MMLSLSVLLVLCGRFIDCRDVLPPLWPTANADVSLATPCYRAPNDVAVTRRGAMFFCRRVFRAAWPRATSLVGFIIAALIPGRRVIHSVGFLAADANASDAKTRAASVPDAYRCHHAPTDQ